jgi:hypothetical protein
MVTIRFAGVFPVFGVTESQVSPTGTVFAVAVKFRAVVLSVLVRAIVSVVAVDPATATT